MEATPKPSRLKASILESKSKPKGVLSLNYEADLECIIGNSEHFYVDAPPTIWHQTFPPITIKEEDDGNDGDDNDDNDDDNGADDDDNGADDDDDSGADDKATRAVSSCSPRLVDHSQLGRELQLLCTAVKIQHNVQRAVRLQAVVHVRRQCHTPWLLTVGTPRRSSCPFHSSHLLYFFLLLNKIYFPLKSPAFPSSQQNLLFANFLNIGSRHVLRWCCSGNPTDDL